MISQALVKVRNSILHDDFFAPVIKAHYQTLYKHIFDRWEDIAKIYHRKNKDVGLTLAILKTLYLLNSWVLKTTAIKVSNENRKADDTRIIFDPVTQDEFGINPEENFDILGDHRGAFDADSHRLYTIADNSRDYDMIDELSSTNRGIMNNEDVKQDIITACLTFFDLCKCNNLVSIALWVADNGEYDERKEREDDSDFYNILSPYPNNILKRRYDRVNRELHIRSAIPSYEDLPECEALSRMAIIAQDTTGAKELEEFGIDFFNAIHSKKVLEQGMKNPYLVYENGLPIAPNMETIRAAIRQKARSKSGRHALLAFLSSIGASKTTQAAILRYGFVAVLEKGETVTRGDVSRRVDVHRPVALAKASATAINSLGRKKVKASPDTSAPVEESKRRGRPRKEPVKRGRGRPKGSIKVAK